MAGRILIVEDDPKTMKLIRDVLVQKGYTVIEATDGTQGIELAKSKKPDLILMDTLMPNIDGITALNAIKSDKSTTNIPVLMVTALDYDLNQKLARQMGAVGYITKPINIRDLLDEVSRNVSR